MSGELGGQQREEREENNASHPRIVSSFLSPGMFDTDERGALGRINDISTVSIDASQAGEESLVHNLHNTERLSCSASIPLTTTATTTTLSTSELLLRKKWKTICKERHLQQDDSTSIGICTTGGHGEESEAVGVSPVISTGPLRNTMATFVFTTSLRGSLRKSPPLEFFFSPGENKEGDGETTPGRTALATSNISSAVEKYDVTGLVETQEAEQLDLQSSPIYFSSVRRSRFVCDDRGQENSIYHSRDSSMMLGFGNRDNAIYNKEGGDMFASISTRGGDNFSTCGKNNGNLGSIVHGVRYEFIRLRKNIDDVNNDDNDDDDDVDEKCCGCCGCIPVLDKIFGTHSVGQGTERVLFLEGLDDTQRGEGTGRLYQKRCGCCRSFCRLWRFMNVFSGDISLLSMIFCMLTYISALLVTFSVCLAFRNLSLYGLTTYVNDDIICHGFEVSVVLTPDIFFSFIWFLVNGLFSVFFAVRAVRYENSGLILCHFMTVLLQSSRLIYFLRTMDLNYYSKWIYICIHILLSFTVALLLLSCGTYWCVYKSFVWRTFVKGITRSVLLRRHQRLMNMQACLEVDICCLINSTVAILFIVDSFSEQIMVAVVVLFSLIVTLLFLSMFRKRVMWFLIIFSTTTALTAAFYCYVITGTVEIYFIRHAISHYEASQCYTYELKNCLGVDIFTKGKNDINNDLMFFSNNFNSNFSLWNQQNIFVNKQQNFSNIFKHCCKEYGHCRLKDAVRTYSVIFLGLLTIIMTIIRIILIWLWFCSIEMDNIENTRHIHFLTTSSTNIMEGKDEDQHVMSSVNFA